MTGVAAAVAVGVSAAAGAYGAHQSAKAANKSKTTTTNQTSTQTPFLYDAIAPDIGEVLARQRGIAAQGTPQVGPDGKIYYVGANRAGAPDAGGAGFTGGSTQDGGGGTAKKANAAKDALWQQYLAGGGNKKDQAAWQAYQKSAPKGGGGGNTAAAGTAKPQQKPMTAEQIFDKVARAGLEAGNTKTIEQGRTAMGNILGAAGGGGPEHTGFEGYNPILDRLANTLEGDVNQRTGRDLLLKFLDAGSFGGGLDGGGGSGGSGRRSTVVRSGAQGTIRASGGGSIAGGAPHIGASGVGGAGGGGSYSSVVGGVPVPDAAGNGLFGTEVRKIFEDAGDQESINQLIEQMNKDEELAMQREMAQLDAAAIGGGRFGGDMWKGVSSDARRAAMDAMLKNSATVRIGDAESRRQARLAALGQVNTRDLGSLQAKTQLDIADRNAAAAGAGAAESAALARRGQDLSALGMLLNNEEFSLGQLGDVGAQLSGDRLSTLGMIPGLEGIGLQGLGIANQAGGGLVDLQNIAMQDAASRRSAGIARAGQAQQLGMFNAGQAQQSTNDYLGTLLRIGGLGGTSTTQGTNVVPGAGINPMGAAVQGAVGGGLQAYGTVMGMR